MAGAEPPYRRIADGIRRQIRSGDLRPGDRVPSARQLRQQHGVAIATATKVLAALQQDGLVHAVPGVGTVVSSPADRGGPPRDVPGPPSDLSHLNRARIVRAAIALADAEGLAALTMRRVAVRLNVATMSLYRHVPGKDSLLVMMTDAVIGERPLPGNPPGGWRARLELAAREQWALFQRHRWLAPAMSLTRPQAAPGALAYVEWILRALDGTGLDGNAMIHAHVMLFSYVRGLAMSFEAEAEAELDTGLTSDEWMDTQEPALAAIAGAVPVPTFARVVSEPGTDLDLNSLFEFGLARMLDGLAVHIREQRGTTPGACRTVFRASLDDGKLYLHF